MTVTGENTIEYESASKAWGPITDPELAAQLSRYCFICPSDPKLPSSEACPTQSGK